jgi:hypothetical protein
VQPQALLPPAQSHPPSPLPSPSSLLVAAPRFCRQPPLQRSRLRLAAAVGVVPQQLQQLWWLLPEAH